VRSNRTGSSSPSVAGPVPLTCIRRLEPCIGVRFLHTQAERPNRSVKGTSCGKPQAAPYLER
jgi:hypothetical protein